MFRRISCTFIARYNLDPGVVVLVLSHITYFKKQASMNYIWHTILPEDVSSTATTNITTYMSDLSTKSVLTTNWSIPLHLILTWISVWMHCHFPEAFIPKSAQYVVQVVYQGYTTPQLFLIDLPWCWLHITLTVWPSYNNYRHLTT